MKRFLIVILFFYLYFTGISFAESIDISDDLQNNIQSPSNLSQALPPVGPATGTKSSEVMQDIYDIKPLEEIGYDTRLIKYAALILVFIILLCLLIYLFDYFLRRRKKDRVEELVVVPADVEAYQLLEELKNSNGLSPREYYFSLTAIIKGYIKKRFDLDAPEMTTEEPLPKLNDIDCEKKLVLDLKAVLTSIDPIKYAGADALQDKMETDFQTVKDFVRQTPLPVAEIEREEKDV